MGGGDGDGDRYLTKRVMFGVEIKRYLTTSCFLIFRKLRKAAELKAGLRR